MTRVAKGQQHDIPLNQPQRKNQLWAELARTTGESKGRETKMHIMPEARLHELGIELPKQLPVIGSYRLAKRHRDIVYIAGHVSLRPDHSDLIRGKVGADLTLEEACEAARICALHMLSTLRIETGSLDQVASILKVFGMVNVAPGFVQLAKVMDGCTDQLVQVFGKDAGTPARIAVGMAELPLNAAIETEMTVALHD